MILLMAWRNTWRNPTRSMVVIAAIALGIWAAMFMTGFATGISRSYINNAIESSLSHIQIHERAFMNDRSVNHYLKNLGDIEKIISQNTEVKAFSIRTIVDGMVASSKMTRGVMIQGIDKSKEPQVSTIPNKLIAGNFFNSEKKNQIVIGKKLAEKLKVKLRSKVVLTFQDLEGTITAGAFRVAGIFESGNGPFDEGNVFIQQKDVNRLLITNSNDQSLIIGHELAILLKTNKHLEEVEGQLEKELPDLQIDTYREAAPDLQLYETQLENISLIYLTIILLALVFGIINTMLMAVLERIKELGMLMAIGMNKLRVFLMIVMETVLLCLIGTPVGMILGYLTTTYLKKYGIDLSAFSKSLQQFGLAEQVYFDVDPSVYIQIPTMVTITALLAAIYPALKAIRLRPVEAIRKI